MWPCIFFRHILIPFRIWMQIKYAIIHVAKNKMNKMTFKIHMTSVCWWHFIKNIERKIAWLIESEEKCKFNIRSGQRELQSNLSLHWNAEMTFKPICKIKVNLRWKKSICKMYPCITITNWFKTSIKKETNFHSNVLFWNFHLPVLKWIIKPNVIIRAKSVISHLQVMKPK